MAVDAGQVLTLPARYVETIALERRAHQVRFAVDISRKERVREGGGTGYRIGQPRAGGSLSCERLRSWLFPGDRRDRIALVQVDFNLRVGFCGILLPSICRFRVNLGTKQANHLGGRIATAQGGQAKHGAIAMAVERVELASAYAGENLLILRS